MVECYVVVQKYTNYWMSIKGYWKVEEANDYVNSHEGEYSVQKIRIY